MPDPLTRSAFLVAISIVGLVLVVSLFVLTSLNLPFIRPRGSAEPILLFALSTFIFLGLVIFGFILFRSLLKPCTERRANQFASKFKIKLVYGAPLRTPAWVEGELHRFLECGILAHGLARARCAGHGGSYPHSA